MHGAASDSDKGAGVVALTMMDLRQRGKVNRIGMAGVNGKKFPGIRAHMDRNIGGQYEGISTECETFPADDECDPTAYLKVARHTLCHLFLILAALFVFPLSCVSWYAFH